MRIKLKALKIDFTESMVLAVAIGSFSTHLEPDIELGAGIKAIHAESGKWTVNYRIVYNDFCRPEEENRHPLFLTKVPKTDRPVVFEKDRVKHGG